MSSKKKYTVAVDFDGVIHSYINPWVNAHTIPDLPVVGAIDWLNDISLDFEVVIFTTRGKSWRGRRAVRKYLQKHGFYGYKDVLITNKKPAALVYIDDRAWRFSGTFPSAQDVHKARSWVRPKQ